MSETDFELDLEELSSAEDFLDYFEIEYNQSVVHVNRLHILQRFHDYLGQIDNKPDSEPELRQLYTDLLKAAYNDFVVSDALTEKVFKVFKMHEPQETFVSLTDLKLT